MVREAAVAGQFYPLEKTSLEKQIEKFFLKNFKKLPEIKKAKKCVGGLSPHAGYVYSGSVASHTYYEISKSYPETFVVLGPNHRGMGSGVSIATEGEWKTPLGNIEIDKKLAKRIHKNCEILDDDPSAHKYEHSIEVQIPFIQFLGDAKLVPICMWMQDLDTAREVGDAIAKSVENPIGIVASSDLMHFGAGYGFKPTSKNVLEWIRERDFEVLKAIVDLNPELLYEAIREDTTCGYGCIAAMIFACKTLGFKKGEILKYQTSYDVSKSKDFIVGYGAAVVR